MDADDDAELAAAYAELDADARSVVETEERLGNAADQWTRRFIEAAKDFLGNRADKR